MEKKKISDNKRPLAYQRTAKYPFIVVKGCLGKTPIQIQASPEGWKSIQDHFLKNHKHFVEDFYSFIEAALNKKYSTLKRGIKKNQWVIQAMKIHASLTYGFFSEWCRKPVNEWPSYLKDLEIDNKLQESYTKTIRGKKLELDPIVYTTYCMQAVYKKSFEVENLNKRYIIPGKTMIESKNTLRKGIGLIFLLLTSAKSNNLVTCNNIFNLLYDIMKSFVLLLQPDGVYETGVLRLNLKKEKSDRRLKSIQQTLKKPSHQSSKHIFLHN